MSVHLHGGSGCAILLIALVTPGVVVAYLSHSAQWVVIVPVGLAVLMLVIAALPIGRKVSPEQFAHELQRHLLGLEGKWDWDDVISVRISDERLEQLRLSIGTRFDSLARQEDRDELGAIIAALQRGEVPIIKSEPGAASHRSRLIRFHLND